MKRGGESLYGRILRTLNSCNGRPAVVVLSHPVKNADRDNLLPRGGGAFVNELDGNLCLWSEALGETTTLHWHGKIRNADFSPVEFSLRPVAVPHLKDAKGRPFVSVVAPAMSPEEAATASAAATSGENVVLYWVHERPNYSFADIAKAARWTSSTDVPNKAKVLRCLRRLKRAKLVKHYRRKWSITDDGKRELGVKKGTQKKPDF